MRAAGQPDALVVINGPEDGAEYTVVRAPFHVGSDETCNVLLRLDQSVAPHHALVTVVSQGYRIRGLGGPVRVDGKRATMFRSRIVRNGGFVNIGHTQLALDCAPDGLAHRSKGIVSESDLGWFIQQAVLHGVKTVHRGVRLAIPLLRRVLNSWVALFAILFIIYYFVSPVRVIVNDLFIQAVSAVRALFEPVFY